MGKNRKPIARKGCFYVYILQCRDRTYYTGYTNNLERRLKEHNTGSIRGAKYLKGKTPVKLVYVKEYRWYINAVRAEMRIKKLIRKRKEELIRIYEKQKVRV